VLQLEGDLVQGDGEGEQDEEAGDDPGLVVEGRGMRGGRPSFWLPSFLSPSLSLSLSSLPLPLSLSAHTW
jgi:hypothetical protein